MYRSAIMIEAARIAYSREPDFEVQPVGAPTQEQRIAWTMLNVPAYREAFEQEGVKVDWGLLKRIAEEMTRSGDPKTRPRARGGGLSSVRSRL